MSDPLSSNELYSTQVTRTSPLSLIESAFSGQTFLWNPTPVPSSSIKYTDISESDITAIHTTLNSNQSPTGQPEVVWIEQNSLTNYVVHSTAQQLAQRDFLESRFMFDIDPVTEYEAFLKNLNISTDTPIKALTVVTDPHLDCLFQFLCSPQMTMDRIHQLTQTLTKMYGETVSLNEETYNSFPTVANLKTISESSLREEGFGYRSKYLSKTSNQILQNNPSIPSQEDSSIRENLLEYYGVGDKVADCVMAYSYADPSAIPIDTWMKTLAETLPPEPQNLSNYTDYQQVLQVSFRDNKGTLDQLFAYELLTGKDNDVLSHLEPVQGM